MLVLGFAVRSCLVLGLLGSCATEGGIQMADWAGQYKTGPGLTGLVLSLQSDGRFESRNWSDTAGAEGSGVAREVPGGIAFEMEEGFAFGLEGKIYPIRWGARRYLVPEDQMDMFIETVNSGWQQSLGTMVTLLRFDGHDQPVKGLPDLPEPYRSQLRKQIFPRLIAVRNEGGYVKLSFDMGRADGLAAEMSLRHPPSGLRAKIRKVDEKRCEAVLDPGSFDDNRRRETARNLEQKIGQAWTNRRWE